MNSARRSVCHLAYIARPMSNTITAKMTLPTITADTVPAPANSEILQACVQREPEQRQRTQHEAEGEDAETAAARLVFHDRLGRRGRRCHHRVFALDHAARDIAGDGIDDDGDVMRFGDH